MTTQIGTAYFDVLPDLSRFTDGLKSKVAAAMRPAQDAAEVTVRANTRGLSQQASRAADDFRSKFTGRLVAAGGLLAGAGLGATFGALVDAAQEAAKVAAQTEAVLKSTGGAANVTAGEISRLAGEISRKTGIDDDAIQSAQNMLLTFTNVRNEIGKGNRVFDDTTRAIVDLSVATGQDFKSSAVQLGKALNDPVKGVTALQRVGVSFTGQQKDQIKTLVASGRALDAQKVILGEVAKEFGGSAEAQATPLDKMRVSIGELQESLGTKLAPAVSTAASSITKFLDDLSTRTGAAGTLRSVVEQTAAALKTLTPVIAGATAGFVAYKASVIGALVVTKLTAGITALKVAMVTATAAGGGLTVAMGALSTAMRANPVGIIVTALAAVGTAFVVAWKRSETFRRIVTVAFAAVVRGAERMLGALTVVTDAASHLPFVGGQFKGISDKINEAREHLRAFRSDLLSTNGTEVAIRVKLSLGGKTVTVGPEDKLTKTPRKPKPKAAVPQIAPLAPVPDFSTRVPAITSARDAAAEKTDKIKTATRALNDSFRDYLDRLRDELETARDRVKDAVDAATSGDGFAKFTDVTIDTSRLQDQLRAAQERRIASVHEAEATRDVLARRRTAVSQVRPTLNQPRDGGLGTPGTINQTFNIRTPVQDPRVLAVETRREFTRELARRR